MGFSDTYFDKPAKLSGPINKVISSLGQRNNFLGWQVVERWPRIAGEQIAAVSKAVRVYYLARMPDSTGCPWGALSLIKVHPLINENTPRFCRLNLTFITNGECCQNNIHLPFKD